MSTLRDGDKFNRLSFVKTLKRPAPDGHRVSLWKCECGKSVKVMTTRVICGKTRSCGCLKIETNGNGLRHGMRHSPEYSVWQAMKNRCLTPTSKDFRKYGAKGITVYPEWHDFVKFYEYVGPRPPGTSLDRIDGKRGYEPGNVRWADLLTQCRNRPDLVIIRTPSGDLPVSDYAKILGLTRGATYNRLKRGKLEGCVQL